MKPLKTLCAILCICFWEKAFSQEQDKSASISLYAGIINYQGDLNQSNFTFRHSNPFTGIIFRKPLNRWFTLRAGANMGKIRAADRWNSNYLKSRNLSFTTTIKEAYAGLEITMPGIADSRLTPYIYGGIAIFHFNPWAYDNSGTKTYLKPLSTEGQGLSQYPGQHPYNLTQIALPFGVGVKFAVSGGVTIGIEFGQRKSFTDYIDDVSTHYVDHDVLYQEKGAKATELAFRTDELPGGRPLFPPNGEQRGTPSEMDWYYFLGLTLETKLSSLGNMFRGLKRNNDVASQRCPRFSY